MNLSPLRTHALEDVAGAHELLKNKRCHACGGRIEHPDDYFAIHRLTRDAASRLNGLNLTLFHRRSFKDWPERPSFARALEAELNADHLRGPAMSALLDTFKRG